MNIRTKLFLIYIPIVLFPLLLIGLLEMYAVKIISNNTDAILNEARSLQVLAETSGKDIIAKFEHNISQSYDLLAFHLSKSIGDAILFHKTSLESMATSTLIETYVKSVKGGRLLLTPQISTLLETAIKKNQLSEAAIVDVSGKEILRIAMEIVPPGGDPNFDGDPLSNYTTDESRSHWFQKRIRNQRLITQSVYFDKDFDVTHPEPVLSLAIPLGYQNDRYAPQKGNIIAYLRFVLPIRALIQKIALKKVPEGITVVLTDNKQIILHHSDTRLIGHELLLNTYTPPNTLLFSNPILNQTFYLYLMVSDLQYHQSSKIVNQIMQGLDKETKALKTLSYNTRKKTAAFNQHLLIVIGVALLLSLIIIHYVTHKISTPIIKISESAARIKQGDLDSKVPSFTGSDEIAVLSANIDEMRQKLQDHIRNLDQKVFDKTEQLKLSNIQLQTEVNIRKMAEEKAKEANIAKSQFLANMSHEIRTPLNGVIGFTEMLLDSPLSEAQTDYVGTIKSSGEMLLSLINDILDFSKIEAQQLELEEDDFDPELIVYNICELMLPKLVEKPVEILCRIGDDIPPYIRGDALRFRQVVTNLMGNATKFTLTGEIALTLDVAEETDQKIKIHSKIRDTGIGIPPEKLSVIFDSFKQVDGSMTRKYGGTGLGLTISKQIAQLMGGDLWAESPAPHRLSAQEKPDQPPHDSPDSPGSRFHFLAWFKKTKGKAVKRLDPTSMKGKRVLIVDDNQTNLEILTYALSAIQAETIALTEGCKVVPTLQEAFLSQKPIALCLCDIMMPGMSGYDVAQSVRSVKEPFATIPMIAISSIFNRKDTLCKEVGFNGFLSKPIQRNKLYRMLDRILGENEFLSEETIDEKHELHTLETINEDLKHSLHILLAEDNPVNQKLAKLLLTKAGYQVQVVDNGKIALDRLQAAPDDYDLIFMDIEMPEMNGIEATQAIRKQGFKELPIIAMTAHAIKGDKERCLEAGMNDYITKPINRMVVFEIIDKWIFQQPHSV